MYQRERERRLALTKGEGPSLLKFSDAEGGGTAAVQENEREK